MARKGTKQPDVVLTIKQLEKRCTALERDVSLLSLDSRLRQAIRRIAALENNPNT